MINAFAIHRSISESVSRGRFNYSEPYNFIGDIETNPGIFSEASQVVALEAYGVQELYTRTDELISEAAANGASAAKIGAMVESVFSKLIEGVKKVWNKIVETIRGLIAKLKAFALRIAGQTGKWVNAMRSKIEAAQKRQRASSAKAEMYEWKNDMFNLLCNTEKSSTEVSNELKADLEKMKSVINVYIEAGNASNKGLAAAGVSDRAKFYTKDHDGQSGSTSGNYVFIDDDEKKKFSDSALKDYDKNNTKYTDEIDKATEGITKNLDRAKKDQFKQIASAYGVSGTDANTIISNIKTKTYGTKKTITYGSKVTEMLKIVENTKELVGNVTEAYDSQLEYINNELEAIKDVEDTLDQVNTENLAGPILTALKSNMTAVFNEMTQVRKQDSDFFNRLKSVATQAAKDRSADYMRVLTKFANTKDFSD